MTAPVPDYDEAGARTRQAWLRTGLGVAAVSLLVERGLLVSGSPTWMRGVGLVPVVLLVALTLSRMRSIGGAEPPGLAGRAVALGLVGVFGLAAVAIVSGVATGR
jgi:hypothetical protein